jgi:hypothetical protein
MNEPFKFETIPLAGESEGEMRAAVRPCGCGGHT